MKTYHNRIEINPGILLGKPVIAGTRIPVYVVLNLVSQGKTTDYILENYPDLTKEDITAALQFAADSMNFKEEVIAGTHA